MSNKRIKHLVLVLLMGGFFLFSSCVSMQLATVTSADAPMIAESVTDATLEIAPVDVMLISSRKKFDLRDVTVTAGGQSFSLGGRYLEEELNDDLGNIGILDTNIFKKAGIDDKELEELLTTYLTSLLTDAEAPFRMPINIDNPEIGCYSTAPVVYDFTQTPAVPSFVPEGKSLEPIFKEVLPSPSSAEYRLAVDLSIESEIMEILTDDQYIQNKYISADHVPSAGDYYLYFRAIVRYSLVDIATEKEIFNENTPKFLDRYLGTTKKIYLPVQNKDADAYAKYFRTYDFSGAADDVIRQIAAGMLPYFRPMYKNLNTYVKVEEEE